MEMSESEKKEIKAARPTNLARLASSFIFIILFSLYDYIFVLYFAILQFFLSLFWFWFVEKKFLIYKKYPAFWYTPASIDVFFATAAVYVTGISYSPVLLAYILITCMSSVDLIRARGLFTTAASCFSFLTILILAKFQLIPFINILNDSVSEISLFSSILSSLLLTMSCFTANSVIFQIYSQLNEKNNELSSSLDRINVLKLQQDADYALTARLMEPFGGNLVKSKIVRIDFLLKQKKEFTFKNQTLQLGGDLLISEELYFNDNKYIFFLNGDAMGKSMQGACGALVLGVISKSIISNTNNNPNNNSPQSWLLGVISEMHRIFQSFEGLMLASVVMGLIEEKTGNLYYINAEHPGVVLYRDESAIFLKDKITYFKIGSVGLPTQFNTIEFIQLIEGDVIFIGSDGKDDIILNSNSPKKINTDEYLFLKIIQKTKGDLKEIMKEINNQGELMDDLSILKISYFTPE